MAGVEDEDEFKDALAAAADADPPPRSPSPTPTSTSKSKPATGGSGGGLGRRLFASIPLPATLSSAIGRFSTPKPPASEASNVGLGLLLDAGAGPTPSADEPPASDDAASGGSSLYMSSSAALPRQLGDDQVAGCDAGVGVEELGLVPAEEGWGTAEDSREKEGFAVDVRSANRNRFPTCVQEEEEGEQCPGDESGAAMGEDQEVVVEQSGGTEDGAAVVEDGTNYSAVEQCSGDETRAVEARNAVEVNEKLIDQECAGGILDAAEDGVSVGLQEDGNAVVEEQGVDIISVQDQHEVVEQCAGDQLTPTTDGNAAQDQEVVVEQQGATEDCAAVVEDESSYSPVEQCAGDETKAVKASNAVEVNERVINQEHAGGILDAAEDGVSVGLQGEENAVVEEQSVIKDGSGAKLLENNVVAVEQGDDGISLSDEDNMVELYTTDQLRATLDDHAAENQNAVEQEGDIVERVVTTDHIAAGEDQDKEVEQSAGDESRSTKDENGLEDNENVDPEEVINIRGVINDDSCMEAQEEGVVVAEQGGDAMSAGDEGNVVEQCTNDQLRATMEDDAAEVQELAEQEGATFEKGMVAGGTTVEDQDKEVEQSAGDKSSEGENAVEDNKKVDQEDAINRQGPAKEGSGVEAQEEGGVVAEQGGDAMSAGDEGNVVEQCTNDQLRATMEDNVAEFQELVEQEGATFEKGMTAGGITVEDQDKEEEQSAGDESSVIEGENAVEDNKKVDQEDAINIQGTAKEDSGAEPQEENIVDPDQGLDNLYVLDEGNVVVQCTSDQLKTTMEDNAAELQEAVEKEGAIFEKGVASDGITVEDQDKEMEESAGDVSRATSTENSVDDKKVYQEDAIDKQGAAKDGSGVESQEETMVVPDQGMDGLSVLDESNVEPQCTSDQLRTTTDNNAAVDPEVAEQEGVGSILNAAKVSIVVEESREEAIMVAEQVEDGVFVQYQDEAVEQRTSDQLRTITDDNAVEDQEVHREKIGIYEGYPQRPGKLNCRFYMSTGSCSYGSSCYFNHPRIKAKLEVSSFPSEQRNHEVEFLELNRVGLPIREGARKCTYYMRNGTCRYGKKCCYNHPEQVLDVQLHTATGWDDANLESSPHSKKSPEHGTMDNISSGSEILPPNILRMLLPPQNVPPCTEEKETRIKKDPDWASASDDSDGCCSADSSDGPLCKQEHGDYPERPECPFLLKFGNCRFASSCRYNHPKDKFQSRYHPQDKFQSRYHPTEKSSRYHPKKEPVLPGELMVYPDRPGEPECPFYVKTGSCKFGANCKFHHPKDISPSMQGPASPKKSVASNEDHPAPRTTLQDQMYQQQKYPERPGQPDCRYYMQFRKCKFQSACVFNHPKDIPSSGWHPAECPFYMKTGSCQFGSACEFYHPKDRCSSRGGVIDGTDYGHDFATKSQDVLQQQEQAIYPERPGELECPHYMKHGYCKFQINCKFHHPRDRLPKK